MNKRTIVFAMHYEAGHIISTFCLAKKLLLRGHDVTYLSIPDFKDLIEGQGFKVALFAEDILPLRYKNRTFSTYRQKRKHTETVFRNYMEQVTSGKFDQRLLSAKPDLFICDPFLSYMAIRALSLGIPTIHLFTSLFLHENAAIPPVTSKLQPQSRFRTLLSWKLMFLRFFFVKKLKNMVTSEYRFPTRMHHLVAAYFHVARISGYPCKKDRTYRLNEIGFNLVLPEIVLCTKAFQFPGHVAKQRMYLGNFVDISREDPHLDLHSEPKPVVYCSLGTAAATYPHAWRFYQAVTEASALRKDWLFILQISDENAIKKYAATENLLVEAWVSQLHVLRNASAMVTHGGLNSIMESVYFEVPMVVVPGMRDQPGNAARAVYNDLALDTTMEDIDADKLIKLVEKAMASQRLQSGLKRMKALIEHEDGMKQSISFIESYAPGKAT